MAQVIDGWERPRYIQRIKLLKIDDIAAITWFDKEYLGKIKRVFLPGYSIYGTYPWEVRYELQDWDDKDHSIILPHQYFRKVPIEYVKQRIAKYGKANQFSYLR